MSFRINPAAPAPVSTVASDASRSGEPRDKAASPPAPGARKGQPDTSIVSASSDVFIKSGNEPLALMLKSAINGINEALAPEFGQNALKNAVSQDGTPEATAGRIVAMSTGFFDAYKLQHPGVDEEQQLKNFMEKIRGGFEQGFADTNEILRGMQMLGGAIAGKIDKTWQLVHQGYAAFEAARSPAVNQAAA